MEPSRKTPSNLSWPELLAVLAVLTTGAVISVLGIGALWPRPPGSCQHNLKHFAMAMRMYGQASKGEFYPPVASFVHADGSVRGLPRFTTFKVNTILPEYLSSLELSECPTDADSSLRWWRRIFGTSPEPDAFHVLQDAALAAGDTASLAYYQTAELARSYVYLGYAVKVVPEFHGWLGATALLPVTGHVQVAGVGEVPIKDFSKNLPVEATGWPAWVPFPDREAGMKALDSSYEVTTLPTVYRLREGIERYFIMDINGPNAPAHLPSALPILWDAFGSGSPGGPVDRFNHETAGSNVLFMDGHVEFIRYPDKFPLVADRVMTDYLGQQGKG